MEDRKELIKALKLIKKTCKSVPATKCNNTFDGDCPIYEILGYCTQEEIPPENWIIKGETEK